jgi:hypothetical protein
VDNKVGVSALDKKLLASEVSRELKEFEVQFF